MRVSVAAFVLLAVACQPVEVTIKPQTVSTNVAAKVDSGAVCSVEPFGSSAIDFEALAAQGGVDLSSGGCLKTADFELTLEVASLTAGSGCNEPRGVVTLNKFNLELTCIDKSTQKISVTCPDPMVDVADGTQVFQKMNACLDVIERDEKEHLRHLINSCRPTAMRAAGQGSCSANTCFNATFKLSFALKNSVAQLTGECP